MFNKLELVNAFNDHCEYKFYTVGVCSSAILISVTDQQEVFDVEFIGGCPGNGKAVGRLVEGMKLEEVIEKLKGVKCGNKFTSCADQLAIACEMILETRFA